MAGGYQTPGMGGGYPMAGGDQTPGIGGGYQNQMSNRNPYSAMSNQYGTSYGAMGNFQQGYGGGYGMPGGGYGGTQNQYYNFFPR
jgi:hypothetical protein